ncbi:PEP/pyruvate-binding domain-containing protein [Streptomyces yaizuensis]|uniref:PEP/pyruvate-binding domain-containing protein n=1 Tax=Streptomyces yaizuensis TaxID=2989713 RepID=A0ABQ5NYH4_9ACTN|nr:PEP/pyruvate-binding domain-containing protein [Streptomyces sp. YSPA8]GLF95427.1 PEP/pyruvate-binding domain-containing protein [Streptomyces sp. YSPA8]
MVNAVDRAPTPPKTPATATPSTPPTASTPPTPPKAAAAPFRTVVAPEGVELPLTAEGFTRIAGNLAGYPFVKVVLDLAESTFHLIDSTANPLHVHYIGERILATPVDRLLSDIDSFNHDVYIRPDRRFYLGLLALHRREDGDGDGDGEGNGDGDVRGSALLSLETVEADTMTGDMLRTFHQQVRAHIDPGLPLYLKPANHLQETSVAAVPADELPRLLAHELFSQGAYVPLHPGVGYGRLRVFRTEAAYRSAADTLRWHDIVVMPRVPDDIPRISGLINAEHTTPLSHTNVLATGWGIPNAIQTDILDRLDRLGLNGRWVRYEVATSATAVRVEAAEEPADLDTGRPWSGETVTMERPETDTAPIVELSRLRGGDHYRYGTKAANIGELLGVVDGGSRRWLGFYRVPRPPRADLLDHLAALLGVHGPADDAALSAAAHRLVRAHVRVPRGIALPFSLQRRFLESSPRIQQTIGRLKMALEVGAGPLDAICAELQYLITTTRLPDDIRDQIDEAVVTHLSGVARFVVRSSSNAEDLAGFSAAGVYASIPDARTTDAIADAVREVWASVVSARSVRLRDEAGISLEDSYMGVIVQEEVDVPLGGVLVTCNPLDARDFRNVYANISTGSVADVVDGVAAPLQHLYNTVEGGGRTLSLGSAADDLDARGRTALGRLALIGRLLQSHFSPDYLYETPVDIEWALHGDVIQLLQIRPYRVRSTA